MSKLPPLLLSLVEKPVAVLGTGVSGKAVVKVLENYGWEYCCYDEDSVGEAQKKFDAAQAQKYGLIVYSPGFPKEHLWLETARKAGCVCLSELDFASLFFKGTIIGVTGTNGKTTLTLFLTEALKKLGLPAIAAGNNGFPLSLFYEKSAKETIAVCEISSFQAESLERLQLDALLWTHFNEDHLDRHQSLKHYFAAKWRLVERLRNPLFITGRNVAEAAKNYGYSFPQMVTVASCETDDKQSWPALSRSPFWDSPQRENFFLARTYWQKQGFPEHTLDKALKDFTPLKHRLNKVAEVKGVSFWNDSKATNFSATLAALSTFTQPIIWIGGGKEKGGAIQSFARTIAQKIKAAFLIGETAPALFQYMAEVNTTVFMTENIEEAIHRAFAHAQPGDAIVLSPGFSSFDQFTSYAQRGEVFEKIVLSLNHFTL